MCYECLRYIPQRIAKEREKKHMQRIVRLGDVKSKKHNWELCDPVQCVGTVRCSAGIFERMQESIKPSMQ